MSYSTCGIDCGSCEFLPTCGGCTATKGAPFYIKDFGVDACPLYDCPANKRGYKSCSECAELPCNIFHEWKDPSMTDEEHLKTIDDRVRFLKGISS